MHVPVIDIGSNWNSRSSRKYMMLGEMEKLFTLLDPVQPKSMVEFGVNVGITANAILKNFPCIEHYVGIDVPPDFQLELPHQQNEVPTEPGMLAMHDERFELVLRPSREELNHKFDACFIDGDHGLMHVLEDYETAKKITNPGGIIIFHDYSNPDAQVTEALDYLYFQGAKFKHVTGTWLVFEHVPWD